MIKATSSLGLPYIEDPNSPFQPAQGCAKLHYSIDSNGHRASTFKAFLPYELAQSRKQRLHICIDTLVRRIELVNNSGTVRAEGVWIQPKRAPTPSRLIRARKEVISCAGPIGSICVDRSLVRVTAGSGSIAASSMLYDPSRATKPACISDGGSKEESYILRDIVSHSQLPS